MDSSMESEKRGVLDQSKSFCLPGQYPWFKAGSVRPSVTCFGKCWAGRAIIQFTGLMYNPFSLSSCSDSQDQPLITFTQPSWFILCIILHSAPTWEQNLTIPSPHSFAPLLPPLELALGSSLPLQNRGNFKHLSFFLHLPFPMSPTRGVSSCSESKHCTLCRPNFEVPTISLLTYAPGL